MTGCVIAALLSVACAAPGPRVAPPPAASPADREGCEAFARRAETQVQGGSMGAGAGLGALTGALVGAVSAARGSSGVDKDGGIIVGAVVGGLTVVGGLVGAGGVGVRNASVRRAAYTEAMDACLRPELLSRELGPDHPEVAPSLHALAYRYYRQGELAKAEPLLARALEIQEKTLGADAPEVATILEDYARLLRQTGRTREAEALERRAREIRSRP